MLEFPRGITGWSVRRCGKSNSVIVHFAGSWARERPPSASQTLEDVIFAGNDRYGARGAAEVTIVFDNEESLAHVPEESPEDEPSIRTRCVTSEIEGHTPRVS